jgi:hypothetical protein
MRSARCSRTTRDNSHVGGLEGSGDSGSPSGSADQRLADGPEPVGQVPVDALGDPSDAAVMALLR